MRLPGIIDKTLELLPFQVRQFIEALQRDNFLRRRLIQDIAVSTAAVSVRHGLGYVPEGYIVVRKNANVTVYNGTIDKNQISITASGSATISILVW